MNFIRIFTTGCYAEKRQMATERNGRASKHTILIIEDDTDIRNFIVRVLELEDYRVAVASDGAAGLEILKKEIIDLVLLDLRLPSLDGWSILREMKRHTELARIPVVVLTAIAEMLQRKKTLRMGAAGYLVKPLSAGDISQTVAKILKETAIRKASVHKTPALTKQSG
jgi:DNA-binding response OmpR family regulator